MEAPSASDGIIPCPRLILVAWANIASKEFVSCIALSISAMGCDGGGGAYGKPSGSSGNCWCWRGKNVFSFIVGRAEAVLPVLVLAGLELMDDELFEFVIYLMLG